MRKLKGNTALIVLIVVLVVVILGAIGTTIYFWQKGSKETTKTTPTPTSSLKSSPAATPTATSSAAQTTQTPTEVAENFMKATLGTLPDAKIDLELARSYLTESLKTQNTGEVWVPEFYEIQDGPTSVKFISQNITDDYATVRFDPSWDDISLGWAFTLKKVGNVWLIDDFRNDAQ